MMEPKIQITMTIEEIEILMMACDKASNSWHTYAKDSKAMNGMYFKAIASATEIVRAKLARELEIETAIVSFENARNQYLARRHQKSLELTNS
jgi:hypothetical protein